MFVIIAQVARCLVFQHHGTTRNEKMLRIQLYNAVKSALVMILVPNHI